MQVKPEDVTLIRYHVFPIDSNTLFFLPGLECSVHCDIPVTEGVVATATFVLYYTHTVTHTSYHQNLADMSQT